MRREQVKNACKDLTILYVEDDELSRQSFLHLIEPLFKKIFIACDGEEGLKLYQNHTFDFIITDIKMPRKDGLEMMKEIQKIDPEIIFSITTAHVDSEFFIRSIDLGVSRYILKPIEKKKVFCALYEMAQMVHNKNKANELSAVLQKLELSNDMIEKLSHYHPLTQLPNKKLLRQKIHSLPTDSALIYFNIDDFGSINDTQGMSVGDQILKDFAKRFEDSVFNERLFHISGDEFVFIMPIHNNEKQSTTKQIQSTYNDIVEMLTLPFSANDSKLHLTISGGVCLIEKEEDEIDMLLNNARNAMKLAKKNGKNTLHFFDQNLQQMALQRSFILRSFTKAYEKKQFFMMYQKQFDTEQNIIGVEALIRWQDPQRGVISPAEFIPVAEESGFIVQLGEWILNETISQLAKFQQHANKRSWKMSVNISPMQFNNENFLEHLQRLIDIHAIDTSKLRLEITENILIDKVEQTLQKLDQIKKIGCSISIDDFGTGYSSLLYLKKLPIDELKIDQSFVKDLTTDRSDETIVKTIINMGNSFGFEVISEGVEKEEQFEKLKLMGCNHFQGYFFAKPSRDL